MPATRSGPSVRRARLLLLGYVVIVVLLTVPRWLERPLLSLAVRAVDRLGGSSALYVGRLVEPALNVVFFVPLALLLCWAVPRLNRGGVVLVCVLTSAAIELTQYLFLPGRDGSLRDVVTNSIGALIGVLLHRLITALRERDVSWRGR